MNMVEGGQERVDHTATRRDDLTRSEWTNALTVTCLDQGKPTARCRRCRPSTTTTPFAMAFPPMYAQQQAKGTLMPGQMISVNLYNVQVERFLSQGTTPNGLIDVVDLDIS